MKFERDIKKPLLEASQQFPVVTVIGPRQSGKTTLVREVYSEKPYRSLENPDIRAFAHEDPRGFLGQIPEGAVLDEIQRAPQLLSYLQQIVDENNQPGRFILTGSQHFLLMEGIGQSLAGRTALLTLLPLSLAELAKREPACSVLELIQRGFYPRLHERPIKPYAAMRDYFQTYVERDVRQLLKVHDLLAFETFVRLCAGRIGQLLNLTSLANDAGISATTAREWISILETSFILFRLPPWHANISKRLIKTPKLFFHDVGLAAYLCGIEEQGQILTHPLRGNLFENLVVSELIKRRLNQGLDNRLCFLRDRTGNEIDILFPTGPDYVPVEVKAGQTVRSEWFKDLAHISALTASIKRPGMIVYGGEAMQQRTTGTACGIWQMNETLDQAMTGKSAMEAEQDIGGFPCE